MKFKTLKDFFSKCDQISRNLWIWSQLLKKYVKENFILCAVLEALVYRKPGVNPKNAFFGRIFQIIALKLFQDLENCKYSF